MKNSNPNFAVEGSLRIDSEIYSADEIIQVVKAQGIPIKKIGSSLRVGQKLVEPISNNYVNVNQQGNSLQVSGLETQISRILSEIAKLKQHVGFLESNNTIIDKKGLFSSNEHNLSNHYGKQQLMRNQSVNPWESNESPGQQNIPILTLGKNRKSNHLANQFQELTKIQGLSDNEALDKLIETKIEDVSEKFRNSQINSQSLHSQLKSDENKLNNQNDYQNNSKPNPHLGRCRNCGNKTPHSAKYCQICGRNIQ